MTDSRVDMLLTRLRGMRGAADSAAVRGQLFEIAFQHMQRVAPRMIRGYPQVRRWDDTADVIQSAALRLHRAIAVADLQDARHLFRLAALQVRRELVDLARKYGSSQSFAAHHETNSFVGGGGKLMRTDMTPDEMVDSPESREAWARFHDAVDRFSEDDRELFDLVWFLGLTQDEVAALLGSSARSVRRRWETIKGHLCRVVGHDKPS